MSESVAIPAALDELGRRLRSSTDQAELIQVLRALQRLRLSEADLCVHIECVRATNDATEQNEDIEENCLLALDLVGGYTTDGLSWDAATMAPIYLGAVLDREALNAGLAHAVHPNDLLPRRPSDRLPQDVADRLVKWVDTRLRAHDYTVEPADIYRTPKSAFTTRPAALLALPDRLALEALAEMISTPLDEALPPGVLWPRGRIENHAQRASIDHRSRPLEWDSKYVVKADIADFYGSVDHTILGLVTSTHLEMPWKYGQAVESLLTALMGIDHGLPQGVPASDLLASTFLLPIDSRLAELDATYIRNGDDYFFPASSVDEARSTLQRLEEGPPRRRASAERRQDGDNAVLHLPEGPRRTGDSSSRSNARTRAVPGSDACQGTVQQVVQTPSGSTRRGGGRLEQHRGPSLGSDVRRRPDARRCDRGSQGHDPARRRRSPRDAASRLGTRTPVRSTRRERCRTSRPQMPGLPSRQPNRCGSRLCGSPIAMVPKVGPPRFDVPQLHRVPISG